MESRYRIKEEYKKFVTSDVRDELFYISEHAGWRIVGYNEDTILSNDEMFEKVEERVKLQFVAGGIYEETKEGMTGTLSKEQLEVCEKALNGELVCFEDVKSMIDAYLSSSTKDPNMLRKMSTYLVRRLKPITSSHNTGDATLEQWDKALNE